MRNHPDLFYAKILLFGEYAVLLNSMGLSIPYSHFRGEFSFIGEDKYTDRNFAKRSNLELLKYLNFLKANKQTFSSLLNLEEFEKEIQQGLYFESTIPESYGLGSSGALCAAIYKRYGCTQISNTGNLSQEEMIGLKHTLSLLESGFHGKSSGLDPLNSYLKTPLLIKSQNEIERVNLPGEKFGKDSAIFLVDTKQTGNTAPLVQSFLNKCDAPAFSKLMEEEFIPLNNACITELTKGRVDSFFSLLEKLSLFQMNHFKDMIPSGFRDLWKTGLDSGKFYLKLCGSGGGGFLLGFTRSFTDTKQFLQKMDYHTITVYQNEQ